MTEFPPYEKCPYEDHVIVINAHSLVIVNRIFITNLHSIRQAAYTAFTPD